MQEPIVIIGIGELAGVFARGLLRCGHPVYPVTRAMDMQRESREIPEPCLVLVMVPENELHPVLERLPEAWRSKVGLLQNELLPRDWLRHRLDNPTVTVVWFEKKPGQGLTNILYSPSYGPGALIVAAALQSEGIPAPVLQSREELLYELARKGLYILTVNICGLAINCSVGALWREHQALARAVADEVLNIQEWLTGQSLPRERLIAGMVAGIEDCPDRYCLGRRAQTRLERALQHAREAGLNVPKLLEIYGSTQGGAGRRNLIS
jgi:hypothetical protein